MTFRSWEDSWCVLPKSHAVSRWKWFSYHSTCCSFTNHKWFGQADIQCSIYFMWFHKQSSVMSVWGYLEKSFTLDLRTSSTMAPYRCRCYCLVDAKLAQHGSHPSLRASCAVWKPYCLLQMPALRDLQNLECLSISLVVSGFLALLPLLNPDSTARKTICWVPPQLTAVEYSAASASTARLRHGWGLLQPL